MRTRSENANTYETESGANTGDDLKHEDGNMQQTDLQHRSPLMFPCPLWLLHMSTIACSKNISPGSFSLTSSRVFGCRSPSVNVSSGCSTTSWARGRCASAALAGRSRESRRRPRTTSPLGKIPEVSFRGSATPRTSSYNSRRWS